MGMIGVHKGGREEVGAYTGVVVRDVHKGDDWRAKGREGAGAHTGWGMSLQRGGMLSIGEQGNHGMSRGVKQIIGGWGHEL